MHYQFVGLKSEQILSIPDPALSDPSFIKLVGFVTGHQIGQYVQSVYCQSKVICKKKRENEFDKISTCLISLVFFFEKGSKTLNI